mmetsp:Transcript_31084/g.75132  ORF Transcript_31084/g.75132 Transcript_31084/m.75132 type:complete len:323 (+) Transcript_31084:583-1551(+)
MLNMVSMTMDAMRLVISAKMKMQMASQISRAIWTRRRPRIFRYPLALSLAYPPRPRANRFMNPKMLAMALADSISSSKRSTKYVTAALFTVSSTPKQHAYWMKRSHVLMSTAPPRKEAAAEISGISPLFLRSLYIPLGQSSLVLMTIMPVQNATNAGTSVTVLHAMVTSPPQITLNSGKSAVPMTSCVAPPPTLPHPPTRPLHRPTISLVNMRVVQHWHITKVDPARPMNRRMQISPVSEFTNPMHAVGMLANINTVPMGILAPNLSQMAPNWKRMTMSNATAQMFVVQISCLDRSRSLAMRGRSGAMANQMKKAMKKLHHE